VTQAIRQRFHHMRGEMRRLLNEKMEPPPIDFRQPEERKTLEERAQLTDLERLRHSASHVLATAILKIWAADCSAAQ